MLSRVRLLCLYIHLFLSRALSLSLLSLLCTGARAPALNVLPESLPPAHPLPERLQDRVRIQEGPPTPGGLVADRRLGR